MKKRLLMILAMAVFLVGCQNADSVDEGAKKPQTESGITSEIDSTTEPLEVETAEETTTQETEKPHEHVYTERVTKEATCAETGEKTFSCECGEAYTEAIESIAHAYKEEVSEPTCTEKGYTTHTCEVCGTSYTDGEVAEKGHSYGAYSYNDDASYEADGTETATCSSCGKTNTRTKEGTKMVSYPEFTEPLYTAWYDGTYFYFYHDQTHEGYSAGYDSLYALADTMKEDLFAKFPSGYGFIYHTETCEEIGDYKNTSKFRSPEDKFMRVVLIKTYPISHEEWMEYAGITE